MLDLPTKEERLKQNIHARFKAEVYKNRKETLFIESNFSQAIQISELTGKRVFCAENMEMIAIDEKKSDLHRSIPVSLSEKNNVIHSLSKTPSQEVENISAPIVKSNNTGVIYTCLTGGYDTLINHAYIDQKWDYVCFTDNLSISNADNSSWQISPLVFDKRNNVRNQRWHKIHPHILFPEYEKSIWLDANINILNKDIFNDVDRAMAESQVMSIAPHPERNCIYDELIVCVALGKDDESVMIKQVDLIRNGGFPEKMGLFETCIMYRNHHNCQVIEVMKDWWWWVENYSSRDQLSLTYVLWQHKLEVKPLAEVPYRYSDGIEFVYKASHVTKNELIVQRAQLQQMIHLRDSQIVNQDERIRTLDQSLNNRELALNSLTAELGRMTSSHSWKVTMPFRFAGRLLRGDWTAVQASLHALRSGKSNSFVIEDETSTIKDVIGKDEAQAILNK